MIRKLWDKVSNLGVESTTSHSSLRRTRIFNQTAFITLVALLIPLIYLFINKSVADLIILYTIIVLEIALILNYFGRTTISKVFTFLSLNVAVSIQLICFGFNYAHAFSYVCLLAMTYSILNNNFDRNITGVIIVLSYIAVRIFLLLNDPLLYRDENTLRNDFIFHLVSAVCLTSLGLYIAENLNQMRENKALVNELKEKNDALENAYKDLESFTYIASHDLKTPVRTVNSFLSLIQSKTKSSKDPELIEYVNFAKKGSNKMTQLIEDILNYSKLEKESVSKSELLDLNELTKEIIYLLKGQEHYAHCEIRSMVLPTIISSRTAFHQLFQNIIENGIKYNQEDIPQIKINSSTTKNSLRLTFEDNGIGIDKDYIDQIFKPFKRLHTEETYEGTGIGLAICKRIIETMNGDINIHSHPGSGSTVIIRIPIRSSYINGQKVLKTV